MNDSENVEALKWATDGEERVVAFFRRFAGGLFGMSFLIRIVVKLLPIIGKYPSFGMLLWIGSAVAIGLRCSKKREYIICPVRRELSGPGLVPVPIDEVERWQVPAEEKDTVVGWGLQYVVMVIAFGLFSAPFFKGEFKLFLRGGKKRELSFARHDTAHAFFDWWESARRQLQIT